MTPGSTLSNPETKIFSFMIWEMNLKGRTSSTWKKNLLIWQYMCIATCSWLDSVDTIFINILSLSWQPSVYQFLIPSLKNQPGYIRFALPKSSDHYLITIWMRLSKGTWTALVHFLVFVALRNNEWHYVGFVMFKSITESHSMKARLTTLPDTQPEPEKRSDLWPEPTTPTITCFNSRN